MEKIDLNALASKSREQPEKTKEEKISELRDTIAQLEEKINQPTAAEKFLQMSSEVQMEKLAEINAPMSEEEKYTLEEYIAEISGTQGAPNLARLRLDVARAELSRLLVEEGK